MQWQEVNRLLRDHTVELRRSSLVISAQPCLEAVYYTNGPVLEGYVAAKLANGNTVCWCRDVRWNDDHWAIEATLDKKSGDRQETVKELPSETVTDFDDFLTKLKQIVRELLTLSITDTYTGTGR
jgi:hypothetical protein